MDKKSDLIIMAGPCSIESEDQIMKIAEAVKKSGAEYLRGGAFKPRTEPGWTGYGQKALRWMRKAADKFELKIVTEILNPRHIKMFKDYGVDLYQVGARSTQYQVLLEAVGRANVPVLLKNGPNTTLKEWLGAAARIPKDNVILCARGKNNETDIAKNGQDIVTLAHLVNNVDYPIIFDPSHSSGKREYVYDVVIGAVAMGVDGILVEVHYDPIMARTDGRQSIIPSQLEKLVKDAHEVRKDHLRRKENKNSFIKATIPAHADIYFLSNYRRGINSIVKKLDSKIYREEEIFPKKKKEKNIKY